MGRTYWPGLLIAALSNAGVLSITLSFLSVEPGAAIRPMGEAMGICVFSGIGIVMGVPLCLLEAILEDGWTRRTAIIGIFLNLIPVPLNMLLFWLIQAWIGFTLLE